MMMMNLLGKGFHLLNRHSRERGRMQMRMVKSRKEVKSKSKEGSKGKEKELKNLRMIIMPLGRCLMLRELFISSFWRIIKGR
jgi:hypothetical protein